MAVGWNKPVRPCSLLHHAGDTRGQSTDSSSPFPFRNLHAHLASVVVGVVVAAVGDKQEVHALDPIVVVVAVDGAVASLVDVVVRGHHDLAMMHCGPI